MSQEIVDARLHALTRVPCPACRRPTAQGTGRLREAAVGSEWLLEIECRRCGATEWVWRREAESLVRRVVRDHRVARGEASSATMSGELGDDGSVTRGAIAAETSASASILWSIRETASTLASTHRRPFVLEVDAAGGLTHAEVADGAARGAGLRRRVDAPEVPAALAALVDRVGLDDLPAIVGEGPSSAEIERRRPGAAIRRTIRWHQRGSARDFGGATVARPLVELVDGLWHLLEWIDAGGPAPRWPIEAALRLFPRIDGLLWGVRSARLIATRDWIGSQRDLERRELWIDEAGEVELRVLRCEGPTPTLEASERRRLPIVDAIFDRLDAVQRAGPRPQIGHVRGSSGLDTTHGQVLDVFDGARGSTTSFVFGTERGLGVDYGDVPPTPEELAAFEALWEAMRAMGG